MAALGDPVEFPITVDHPRNPMIWYGRTKLLNERAIEDFVDGAFPAHRFMNSNLYDEHEVDGQRVSKGTVTIPFRIVDMITSPVVRLERKALSMGCSMLLTERSGWQTRSPEESVMAGRVRSTGRSVFETVEDGCE
jgi:hypothetical protein